MLTFKTSPHFCFIIMGGTAVVQFLLWISVGLVAGNSQDDVIRGRSKREATCAAKFQLVQGHSACLPEPKNKVNDSDKKVIVDLHNSYRANATPTASDMLMMKWDDEVAMIAQKWADNCNLVHDQQRGIPGRFGVGQNLAMGTQSWAQAIKLWYDEISLFQYGNQAAVEAIWKEVGHYTQVMWAKTSLVGCGYSMCGSKSFYVCNYAPAGNLGGQIHLPYTQGPPCDSCPSHCDTTYNKLCDCGRTCLNSGTLNLTTCECKCPEGDFYQPDTCSLQCGNRTDPKICTGAYSGYGCNAVQFNCPNRCRLCPYAEDGYSGPPPPKVDSKGVSTRTSDVAGWKIWVSMTLAILTVI